MDMKQTAVDYLDEAIDKYLAYYVEGSHKGEPFKLEKLYAAVQQAKAMHKQEQENTWYDSRIEDMGDNYIGKQKSFEQYYNETFGGNNGE